MADATYTGTVRIPQSSSPSYTPGDDEGFVQNILTGLKAIPHLPAALLEGMDAPGITPEESKLRHRAVGDAALWVIPAVVSGGAAALIGAGAGPLVAGIVEAAGFGAGSALSAKVQGQDPLSAGLSGAALGGVLGAGGAFFKQGAQKAAAIAAEETASRLAAEEAAQKSVVMGMHQADALAEDRARRAAQAAAAALNSQVGRTAVEAAGTDVVLGGKPLVTRAVQTGQQDLFDLGAQANVGTPNEGLVQQSLFGEAPTIPGQRSAIPMEGMPSTPGGMQALYGAGELAARPDLPGVIPTTDRYTGRPPEGSQLSLFEELSNEAKLPAGTQLSAFNEVPHQTLAMQKEAAARRELQLAQSMDTMGGAELGNTLAESGNLYNVPTKFSDPTPVPAPRPVTEGVDAALANEGITPSTTVKGPSKARRLRAKNVTPLSETFGPDQVLSSGQDAAKSALVKGDLVGPQGGIINVAKNLKNKVTQTQVYQQAAELVSRAMSPARTTLARMGPTGAKLAGTLDKVFDTWRKAAGADIGTLRTILTTFNKDERIRIGQVLDGLANPVDERMSHAVSQIRNLLNGYAQEAEQLGIRELGPGNTKSAFRYRENYFPHYITDKSLADMLKEGTPANQQAVRYIMETRNARTTGEAQLLLKRWLTTPSEFRTGPINFARSFPLPYKYEQDPEKAISRYIFDVRKRLEIAKEFGASDKGKLQYVNQIAKESGLGSAKVASSIYDAFASKLPDDYSALSRATSTYNVLTMLSTSGLVQPGQWLNIAAKTDYASTIKAIGALLKNKESRDWALSTGSYIEEAVADLLGTSSDSLGKFFTKNVIGLEPLDKANRVIAALAGRFRAIQLAEKFAEKQSPRAAEALTRLGLNPADVLAQKGVLTNQQLRNAAYRVSVDTQFASSVMDLPEFKNHPLGKVLYQFKPFALQQAQFIQRDVLAPAVKYLTTGGTSGTLAPLARYSAGIGPMGAVIGELVRNIKGRPAPDSPVLKQLENMSMAGGLGIWYDMWNAMDGGSDRIMSFLAGPTAGELTGYLGEGAQALQGKPDALLRHVVRRIPVVGQTLSNYWLYPPKK